MAAHWRRVTGKRGAVVREGLALDTPEVAVLPLGTRVLVDVVGERGEAPTLGRHAGLSLLRPELCVSVATDGVLAVFQDLHPEIGCHEFDAARLPSRNDDDAIARGRRVIRLGRSHMLCGLSRGVRGVEQGSRGRSTSEPCCLAHRAAVNVAVVAAGGRASNFEVQGQSNVED